LKTGDPKKAGVLGAVALVIIAVAVVQNLPKDEPKPGRPAPAQAGQSAGDAPPVTPLLGDTSLTSDPFSHKVLQKKEAEKQAANAGDAKGKKDGKQPKLKIPPEWETFAREKGFDAKELEKLPNIGIQSETEPLHPDPSEIDRLNQELQSEQPKKLVLEAIVGVTKQRAFLAIDGKGSQAYSVGQVVDGVGVICFIGESSVVLKVRKRTITLRVGGEVNL
jgi:hypothetical protein